MNTAPATYQKTKELFKKSKQDYNKEFNQPYIEILSKVKKYGFELPENIDPELTDANELNKYILTPEFAQAFLKYLDAEYEHPHTFKVKYMNLKNSIMWDKPMLKNLNDFVIYELHSFDVRSELYTYTDKYHEEVKQRIKDRFKCK